MERFDDKLLSNPAPGFTVVERTSHSLTLHHRQTGMGCIGAFFAVWLTGWWLGCFLLLVSALREKPQAATWGMAVLFWSIAVGMSIYVARLFFTRKTFRLDEPSLTVEERCGRWSRTRSVPKTSIERLVQIQDGGKGEDSFPTWGLRLDGEKPIHLLGRQPYPVSHWLGSVIAGWAGVEFIPQPPP